MILRPNSGHKQLVDGELIVVYVRMRLKVRRRREMKFTDLFGGDEEPVVKVKAETKTKPAVKVKTEPVVKAKAETKTKPAVKVKTEPAVKAKTEPKVRAKAETKWKPKVKGKAAAKRRKSKKRF